MRRRDFVTGSLLSLPMALARGEAGSRPVVLELFTSQGCSSCPPADALLGELTRQPGVIGLAWHVDYWNSLGWRDPYARSEWTDRQRAYASQLRDEVYTPAMVVNGATMVVGSDKSAVYQAIGHAVPLSVPVTLRRTIAGMEAEIGPGASSLSGLLVSYDPMQTTEVGAGENRGRRLFDYRVVREVVPVDRLSLQLKLPLASATRGAILLIKDTSMQIVGATDLPPVAAA